MADQEISLQETLQSAVEHHLENMNTCVPGFVIRTINDLQGQQIDVQIAINFKGYDGSSQERPPILNVPVVFPASSTSAITFPLNPGDPVLLVFSQRGLTAWKGSNGYASTPTDYRMHDIRDCFAIPGPFPVGRAPNNPAKRRWPHSTHDLVVAHNLGSGTEVELRLSESGSLIINTDMNVEINATQALVNVPNSTWTGDINHTGMFINNGVVMSNGVTLHSHTHNQPADSGGDTELPTFPPNPG